MYPGHTLSGLKFSVDVEQQQYAAITRDWQEYRHVWPLGERRAAASPRVNTLNSELLKVLPASNTDLRVHPRGGNLTATIRNDCDSQSVSGGGPTWRAHLLVAALSRFDWLFPPPRFMKTTSAKTIVGRWSQCPGRRKQTVKTDLMSTEGVWRTHAQARARTHTEYLNESGRAVLTGTRSS